MTVSNKNIKDKLDKVFIEKFGCSADKVEMLKEHRFLSSKIGFSGIIQVAAILSEKSYIMCAILFFAVLIIEIIGTVNHPNIDMDKDELQENKKSARLLVLMEAAVIILLDILGMNQLYVSYMSIAIILCSLLMCVAKLLKQEVKVR